MNTRSIRFRLIAWYAGLLSGVFLVLAGLMFWELNHYLEANLSETQTRRARQIADTLLANVKQTGEAFVAGEIKSLYAPEIKDRFIRITRQDGTRALVSGPPKDQSFDPADVPPFTPTAKTESAWKQKLAGPQDAADRRPELSRARWRRATGRSRRADDADRSMLHQLLVLLAIGLPIVALVAIGGGYLLVGRALAPVDEIARKAEQITQHNLSERLPVANTAEELERLALALNRMIGRLEDAFLNSKRFVADASHELRTPLTALRAEVESLVADKQLSADMRETPRQRARRSRAAGARSSSNCSRSPGSTPARRGRNGRSLIWRNWRPRQPTR